MEANRRYSPGGRVSGKPGGRKGVGSPGGYRAKTGMECWEGVVNFFRKEGWDSGEKQEF